MVAMAVNGLKLMLLLICIYSAQCNVCKMKSMQKTPMCAKGQDKEHKEHHVSMDSTQTWDQGDQGDQGVSDPALVAEEPKNISSADVSVSGDGWVGFSNDSMVGDVFTTTVYQDVVEPDFREGIGSEQQDPANSTYWPSAPDRGNITSMDNVTRRDRVFGCPQLSWEGAGVTITIAVCAMAILCGVSCITWDFVEWCKGDIGKPGDENQLCYHCRRIWWVCTVPRGQQRQWRVTQNRKWRERNVRQVVPTPVQGGSGLCDNGDNGFQEIELGVMEMG